MGEGNFLYGRPPLLQELDGLPNGSFNIWVHSLQEILLGDTQLHPPHIINQGPPVIRHLEVNGGGIIGVVPADAIHQDGTIGYVFCYGPNLIQGRGKGHKAKTGNPAIGRLQAHHPTAGCGLSHRTTSVRTQRGYTLIGGNRGGRSPTGSAGNSIEIPGISGNAEPGVLRRGSHGKLIHVHLP